MAVDHHARAHRLSQLIDGERHVREESIEEPASVSGKAPIDLDAEIPHVPWRYVAPTYDGSDIWMEFADTLDEMKATLEDAVTGEIPWAPGEVVDLDTEEVWSASVDVTLVSTTREQEAG